MGSAAGRDHPYFTAIGGDPRRVTALCAPSSTPGVHGPGGPPMDGQGCLILQRHLWEWVAAAVVVAGVGWCWRRRRQRDQVMMRVRQAMGVNAVAASRRRIL